MLGGCASAGAGGVAVAALNRLVVVQLESPLVRVIGDESGWRRRVGAFDVVE